jgi:hypothetical protein
MLELPEGRPGPKRGWIYAGALVATVLVCYLALVLGAWGFDFRRYQQHEGRLRRLALQHPTLDRVILGLSDEGSALVDSPVGAAALEQAARVRGGRKAGEVMEKGSRWPITRVFLAADMVYFLYFDGEGVLRDFTCVSR